MKKSWAQISIVAILFFSGFGLSQAASPSTPICETLIEHYSLTWHRHQELALQIQAYPHPRVLDHMMELLNLHYETLMDTARLMERHRCDLPENF